MSTDQIAGKGTIVVGVDGSESSLLALRSAAQQAELTGAKVVAILAWQVPFAPGSVSLAEIDWARDAQSALDHAVKSAIEPSTAALVEQRAVRGHPAKVLLDASVDADLLVVGSRGRGGFTGLLLGSVSQHLVTHATCPVMVVRPRAAAA